MNWIREHGSRLRGGIHHLVNNPEWLKDMRFIGVTLVLSGVGVLLFVRGALVPAAIIIALGLLSLTSSKWWHL